ncbi:MAG: hypothetical protein H0X66_15055 [Verrucomicrobia bacterium]|nr:hypothetical protein [Verrucomicrobiota bacterium]
MFLLVAGDGNIPDLLEPFADYGGEGTNPNAKFDWFEIGGRFGPSLSLKQPRQLRRFFGLLPGGTASCVLNAKKSEVDLQSLLANPPAALLFQGQWSESVIFAKSQDAEEWRKEFTRLFEQIHGAV